MKNLLKSAVLLLLITSFAVCSVLNVAAETLCDHAPVSMGTQSEGIYSYTVVEDGVMLTSVSGNLSKKITIPSQIAGKDVVELGNFLFRDNTKITSVVLPDTLKIIGSGVFEGCTALKSVSVPDSVTRINGQAFKNCTSLKTIKLSSHLESIENEVFSGCTALNEIDLPDKVNHIAPDAFCDTPIYTDAKNREDGVLYIDHILYEVDNTVADKYTVKKGTKHINIRAFNLNTKLKEIVLPNGMESIGAYAFYECKNLSKVTLPSSLKTIDVYAFYGCSKLKSISLPSSLKILESGSFSNTGLKSITIPGTVKTLSEVVFEDCKELTEVILADGITEISEKAFSGCEKLKNVSIPKSVETIGQRAFNNTPFFKTKAAANNGALYVNNILCQVNEKLSGTFEIKKGTTKIADSAFSERKNIKNIIIPETVTKIGEYSFFNCSSLKKIDLPESITEIGEGAFYGCTSLTSLTFPGKITTIPKAVLADCKSIKEINIGKNVSEIFSDAFSLCPALKRINISAENEHFSAEGPVLFNADKTVLIKSYDTVSEEYTVPLSVKEIGNSAFSSAALKSIKLHENITKIGADAFLLSGINIAENKTNGSLYIDDCLIYAANEEKYTVKDGTRVIADEAFTNNFSMKELCIPESVKYIGDHLLYGSVYLEKVTVMAPDAVLYKCSLNTNAVICGYSYSTTEEYAKLNGLNFKSIGTAPIMFNETDEVMLYNNSFIVIPPEINQAILLSCVNRPVKVVNENGTLITNTTAVASGMKLISDTDKSLQKTIIAICDVDKDGNVSASDARIALRASVGLETLSDVQKIAANADTSDADITASDARILLRASVGLEDVKEIFTNYKQTENKN